MTVTTYIISKGQPTQYFGLKDAAENQVLYGAPNNWKTENGALRWAWKHGFTIISHHDSVTGDVVAYYG